MKKAQGDADPLIVSTALELASQSSDAMVVVGNDTDLQCMLIERAKTDNIYMQLDTGCPNMIYSIKDAQNNMTVDQCKLLHVIHCFSGCDTTSSLYSKGKVSAWNA